MKLTKEEISYFTLVCEALREQLKDENQCNMRNIELTDGDCIFIRYVLKQYANTTDNLDREDKLEIYEVANKFK